MKRIGERVRLRTRRRPGERREQGDGTESDDRCEQDPLFAWVALSTRLRNLGAHPSVRLHRVTNGLPRVRSLA